MGRNKYSAGEIKEIGKLLRLKNAGNRLQQKMIRHDLTWIMNSISLTSMSLARLSEKKSCRQPSSVAPFRFSTMPPSKQ